MNSDQGAFPLVEHEEWATTARGLTKREHFAGLALQGLLAGNRMPTRSMIRWAVVSADLLLEQLEAPAEIPTAAPPDKLPPPF